MDTKEILIEKNTVELSEKKPIYKKFWFWGIIAIVLVAIVTSIYFIFFNSVKPKLDENGKQVFTKLSDNVYASAEDYLGYHVSIKGIVFQALGNSKDTRAVHVWLAPETSDKSVIIQYNSDAEINSGDYITCNGYIKSVSKFKNDFDTEIITPIIYSSDIKKISYIEAMRPTLKTVELSNAIKEQYKYSISVDKVEFAAEETRLYLTVTNNGSADFTIYEDMATIVQDGKQYDTQYNREGNYEELSHNIVVGAKSSGIITFPAIEQKDFKFIIEGYSPVYEEDIEEYIFNISMTGTSEQATGNENTKKDNGENSNVISKTPATPKNDLYEVQDAVVDFCNQYNTSSRKYGDTIGCFMISGTEVMIQHSAGTIPESAYSELSATGKRLLNELSSHINNNCGFPEWITVTLEENYWFLDESYYEE